MSPLDKNIVYTGSFSRCFDHPGAVCTATGVPKNFKGAVAYELAPGWAIAGSKAPRAILRTRYLQLLTARGLTPEMVYERYRGKILLCYEVNPNKCHRRWLSAWLREAGFGVEELFSKSQNQV